MNTEITYLNGAMIIVRIQKLRYVSNIVVSIYSYSLIVKVNETSNRHPNFS